MAQITPLQKFPAILHSAAGLLAKWLNDALPELSPDDWWSSFVVKRLSTAQAQRIQDHGITSLKQLDLAALLRVLDSNWHLLSERRPLTMEHRNYTKEMFTIRNRWAHVHAGESWNEDDLFRDIDTLDRFLRIFGADEVIVQEVRTLKREIRAVESPPTVSTEVSPEASRVTTVERQGTITSQGDHGLKPGDVVCLKSDPSRRGVIIGSGTGDADPRYTVFLDNKPQEFYRSQLQPVVIEERTATFSLNELHCLLTSLQVQHPSSTVLHSLNAARIDFVPYQFRPALKIIRSDQPRLLIADGVGVGKTIEAGLILRELQARQEMESVLIICPKPLVAEQKWQREMRRFDERFEQLDGKALRNCIREADLDGEWPERQRKIIIPYSLFDGAMLHGKGAKGSGKTGLSQLDPPPRFDLVIVDEAHHIRNSNTFAYDAVRLFVENAEAVLFLTATPIQMDNQDLFVLLNLLRPDLVIDKNTFRGMAEPNPAINAALRESRAGGDDWCQKALKHLAQAESTSWGRKTLSVNPDFHRVQSCLRQGNLSREDRVRTIHQMESFNTFWHLISRTRRRDIGAFCIRRPETVSVEFTESQKLLHDSLIDFERTALSLLHGTKNIGFMLTTIRRQASSCIFGLAPLVHDILERRLSRLEEFEGLDAPADDTEDIDDSAVGRLRESAQAIFALSKSLPSEDPKLDTLREIVRAKQNEENNKLMVFSTFRHTLAYLEKRLAQENVRIGLIHGDIDDDARLELRDRFERPREEETAIDVMLFSEVGCEGLDYQFCNAMVNYDLPWNPMRVEQRIGRIDRRGQKSDVVTIYNLITPGTVDADVFERCLTRIGVFEANIGECEEILGAITKGIQRIAENLELSEEERRQKLEQLADNQVRALEHQRELEDREHELFGIQVPKSDQDEAIREAESSWLDSLAIQRLIRTYLEKRCGEGDYVRGDKPLKTLRLSKEARARVLEDFRALAVKRNEYSREWENWLKGENQHCSITFDSECAMEERKALFITPVHPLTLQAARHLSRNPDMVRCALRVSDDSVEPGVYPFAVYEWKFEGIRPELQLVSVCERTEVEEMLFEYLEQGIPDDSAPALPHDAEMTPILQQLESRQRQKWEARLDEHRQSTARHCDVRRASLKHSFDQKIATLEHQLNEATSSNIQKMREGQLARARTKKDRKLAEVEAEQQKADIHTRCVAVGVVRVEG